MNCPKCRRKQYYTCSNPECTCQKSVPKNAKPLVHLEHDGLACPYCGHTAHMDYWEERAMQELKGDRNVTERERP
jgi:hypothetical protein